MAGSKALSFWYRQLQGAGGGPREAGTSGGRGLPRPERGARESVCAEGLGLVHKLLAEFAGAASSALRLLLCCPGKPGASPGSARRGGDAGGRRTELGRGWVAAAWTVGSERPGEPTDLEERPCPGINPGEF
ncbi:unnamed protein product [Lepidochelys kempii]